ncbi:MAG: YidC/Oxa1 family membrane protein insertase [Clostridia bacterium]|nr:YidC/Oxa1 family membrane protein insertase [Clostridia bacterium]
MKEIIFAAQSAGGLEAVIRWIIQIGSSIALGIILFTLILKLITMPFDAISRVQMRKNSLIMESMRPELERLQKQYANDKALYNQKMMALYKKNGYSMFGACLPTIITLVVFIIAINAFTGYSKYQNRVYFLEMSKAFNNAIYQGIEIDDDLIKYENDHGILIYNTDKIVNAAKGNYENYNSSEIEQGGDYRIYEVVSADSTRTYYITLKETADVKSYAIKSNGGYAEFTQAYSEDGTKYKAGERGTYTFDQAAVETAAIKVEDKTLTEYLEAHSDKTVNDFIAAYGSTLSANKFHEQIEGSKFLWIRNIWVTDSPMAHPVESSWDKFKSAYSYKEDSDALNNMNENNYKLLIADLGEEQTAKNGYFILAVLTAGIAFLMQFVTSKSQKASMELQTVNGQGARTQKIMMWVMPIMMAIFAFMYTAAFSIYMILSQAISIVFTLLINWLIDKKFKNKEMAKEPQKIRGRVYVPETKPEEEKGNKNKKDETPEHDFIKNGKTSHVRGRLK